MKKRNHILFGIVLACLVVYLIQKFKTGFFNFSLISLLLMGLIVIFYSILPDIDHKGSSITHIFFGIGILGSIIGLVGLLVKTDFFNPTILLIFSIIFLVFTYISSNFMKHRGIIHSIPIGLIASIPLFFLFHNFSYCILAYVSWHSHLIGDGYWFKMR